MENKFSASDLKSYIVEQPKRKRAPGGGRPPKPHGEKRVKTAITLRPDHYDSFTTKI